MASLSALQSAGSRVYARARADPAVTLRADAPDAAWLTLADELARASAAIPAAARQNLRILGNIGCQYAPLHTSTARTVAEASGVDVPAGMARIEAALKAGGGAGPFLMGDGSLCGAEDLALACALRDLVGLVFTIKAYPALSNWFTSTMSLDACVQELGTSRALGTRRIGCQIDLRPDPTEAFKAATKSIALNEGQKKKKSQRQMEKANKEAKGSKNKGKKSKDGGGDASKASSDEEAPRVNSVVTSFPATHEEAHDNLLSACKACGTIQLETPQAATVEEEVASWAKTLFLKDKKKKKLFMVTVPGTAPSIPLKMLSKAVGVKELRMAGAKDMKAALGLEKGCVTAMSVVNDVACKITSVIDKRCIGGNFRMCSGCNDPKDHTQHHISEQSTESLMAFLEACGHAPMIFDHEANTVEKNH